jgi:4'-phosphopantetheinyl transferase
MANGVPAKAGASIEDLRAPWPLGPARPALRRGEIHVWLLDTAEVAAARGSQGLSALLAPEERERAERMTRSGHRELWIAAHAALRALLGRYLDRQPHEVALVPGPYGKPRLRGQQRLSFNLSHSAGAALYAFCLDGAVGVDVEFARGSRRHVAIARRALGEDTAESLLALDPPSREREFLRVWTRHEAAVKFRGTGLRAREGATDGEPAPWIAQLEPLPGAAAAIAAARAPARLQRWTLDAELLQAWSTGR